MEPMKPMAPMRPMEPMKPMVFEQWWPKDLGHPSTSGAQNGVRYAFFSEARRLLIDRNGEWTTYDTGDHQINGVSSQQSGGQDGSLSFASQHGPVRLDEMHVERRSPDHSRRDDASDRKTHLRSGASRQIQHQGGGFQGQSQGSSNEGPDEQANRGSENSSTERGNRTDRPHGQPQPTATLDAHASNERIVFSEEGAASGYIKLIAKGDVDLDMIEALEDFVRRQKRRLTRN